MDLTWRLSHHKVANVTDNLAPLGHHLDPTWAILGRIWRSLRVFLYSLRLFGAEFSWRLVSSLRHMRLKKSQDGSYGPQHDPKRSQNGAKGTQGGPKIDLRWTQEAPKGANEGPRMECSTFKRHCGASYFVDLRRLLRPTRFCNALETCLGRQISKKISLK